MTIYVPRPEIERYLDQQLENQSPEYRLASLVGTVGIGKSSLLREQYKKLHNKSDYLAFWLDFSPDPYDPISMAPLPDYLSDFDLWVETCQQKAETFLGQAIRLPLNPTTYDGKWQQLINRLCTHSYTLVLFVDGYDNIEDAQQRLEIQEKIIATFLNPPCTRIFLARRDEQSLDHGYLRWNEEAITITGLTELQQREQIERRNEMSREQIQLWLAGNITSEQLQQRLELTALTMKQEQLLRKRSNTPNNIVTTPYLSENPFINTFLFNTLLLKGNEPLNHRDIGECLDTLLERAGIPFAASGRKTIQELVTNLPESWTVNALQQKLNRRIDDPELKHLVDAGIVSGQPRSSRYQVDQGVYFLMQRYLEMMD